MVKILILVEFQLEDRHPRKHPTCRQNLLQQLLCECDQRAQETCERINKRERVTNIQFYRQYTLMQEDLTKSRVVKEAIYIIDAIKAENQYINKKFEDKANFIDTEARINIKDLI